MKKRVESPLETGSKSYQKKKTISLAVLILGGVAFIAGVVMLTLGLTRGNTVADGEYLVAAESWVLDEGTNCADEAEVNCAEEASVIWQFTEIGKGKLTTNAHQNDYDFVWALEGGKLKIQTEWLYELENEYDYTLDQRNGILTLTDGDESYRFVAQ